jgi:hypothetical protein
VLADSTGRVPLDEASVGLTGQPQPDRNRPHLIIARLRLEVTSGQGEGEIRRSAVYEATAGSDEQTR